MKILLNLLPEDRKKEIKKKLRFRFFLWQLFFVLLLELLFVSLLASLVFFTDLKLVTLKTSRVDDTATAAAQEALGRYQEKFAATNALVGTVGRIERAHLSFTAILVLLEGALPPEVMIERLATQDRSVMLAGQAKTRDALLLLENRLKQSDCAKNVRVPLSNLFSETDVDFQIDFEMQETCLRPALR